MKDSTQNTQAALLASNAPEGSIPVPIVMYHALINDKKYQNKFFISPKLFEKDLKYLKENNYTPIFMKDLIAYVDQGTPLPEKPILITFDDGFYNNYLYAYPLLREYNMKAVISIVGKFTDKFTLLKEENAYYSYLTWDQVNEMSSSGLIEIQNHSYDMHYYNGSRQGVKKKISESQEEYRSVMENDIGALQDKIFEMTGQKPTTFTYPFGLWNKSSQDVLKSMGFRSTLSCAEGVNYITRDPECLYRLKRVCRSPSKSSEAFF